MWLTAGMAVGLTLLASCKAPADEFPATAYSSSLASPPELVDPMSLLFRLPQRAAGMESQLFAFSSSSTSVGAVGNTHGHGFFLLAQPEAAGSIFQAGWGGSLQALRLGLAGRVGRRNEEYLNLYDQGENVTYEGGKRTRYEGTVGLGVGTERFELDVAADILRLDAEESFLYLRDEPSADTGAFLESGDDWSFGGTAHLRAVFGDAVELTAVGFWSRLETTYRGLDYADSRIARTEVAHATERWAAGACVAFPIARLDQIAVLARWLRTEREMWDRTPRLWRVDNFDQGQFSIALRQRLWQELWGNAGINLSYTKEGDRSEETNDTQFIREDRSERFSQDFSWGATYAWRNVDLRAAVRENFPLSDLFFSLDVIVRP